MSDRPSDDTNDAPRGLGCNAVVRPQRFCSECGQVHDFRVPKFCIGQRVRLVSEYGLNHYDKVGKETVITGIGGFASMPSDEVEYCTEFGFGMIMESRLESV